MQLAKPKPRLLIALLALALVASLAAGCGGSDDPEITKAELIKQGDAICERADNVEYNRAAQYQNDHKEEFAGEEPLDVVYKLRLIVGFPSILEELEELEDLGIPKGDEKQLEAIYTGIEKAVAEGRKDPKSIDAPGGGPFAEVNRLARAYGFKACSEPA